MPFDALTYKILASELDFALSGGRIEKIGMPSKEDVLLFVRTVSQSGRDSKILLVSCNPSHPRIHITRDSAGNPAAAFSFLMHLRKHIGGGEIKRVSALERERIVALGIEAGDELGYKKNYTLYAEMVGRYPNLILTDSDGKITDSLRRISFDEFSARAVLPGLPYAPPPAQAGKVAPDDEVAVTGILRSFEGGKLADYLMTRVYGYAPVTMRELVFRAYGSLSPEPGEVSAAPERFLSAVRELDGAHSPCTLAEDGKVKDVFAEPFLHMGAKFDPQQTLSDAAAAYFADRVKAVSPAAAVAARLEAAGRAAIKKNAGSLAKYREQALAARDCEEERKRGELLTANLYRIPAGSREIEVEDYYTGGKTVIKLDPALSPQMNAQKYFKVYSKKKTALEKSEEHARAAEERADYYESLLAALENAETEADAAEIAAEMEAAGIVKRAREKRQKKAARGGPLSFTVGGLKLLVGKNNLQNDALVRSSDGGWLWLHTQKIHGSHGVICAKEVPQNVINEAAAIVAHYSKAAMSANVPVDYTLVKYVKKPSGALPGKVIYTHQKTVNVTPKKPQ